MFIGIPISSWPRSIVFSAVGDFHLKFIDYDSVDLELM